MSVSCTARRVVRPSVLCGQNRRRRVCTIVCPGHPVDHGVGRHRFGDEVSLHLIAADVGESVELSLGFHSFGDDEQIESPAEPDHHLDDGMVFGVRAHSVHEALVDLDRAERKTADMGER